MEANCRVFRENSSVLLGRSPGPQFLAKVERLALSVPGVLGVHDLRAEYVGPETVHAGRDVEVERGLPIEEADRIAEEVRGRIHRDLPEGYFFVHLDPAEPREAHG